MNKTERLAKALQKSPGEQLSLLMVGETLERYSKRIRKKGGNKINTEEVLLSFLGHLLARHIALSKKTNNKKIFSLVKELNDYTLAKPNGIRRIITKLARKK